MPIKAPKAVPEGMHTVTVHLWFNGDCKHAISFYQKAFQAEIEEPPVPAPDGNGIMHVMMKIGDSNIMMADAWPNHWEQGPIKGSTASLWLYVDDCDALYKRALDAGCEVVEPIMDAFWGDRNGKVRDPFGHCWSISSHKWILSEQEMLERMDEWLKGVKDKIK